MTPPAAPRPSAPRPSATGPSVPGRFGTAPSVAVVGATGQVGQMMLRVLARRGFPIGQLRVMASSRSAGGAVTFGSQRLVIEDAAEADLSGVDLALFSAGAAASRVLAPRFVAVGATVIDNSSAWRSDPTIPLVVSEVNPEALEWLGGGPGIIANPNCTTMVGMVALAPLHRAAGLERLTVATYQAVSGAGLAGSAELEQQLCDTVGPGVGELAFSADVSAFPRPEVFPGVVAHNVLPLAGTFLTDGSGDTTEERKLADESAKILGVTDLDVTVTCVRVPVFTGHSLAICAEFSRELSVEEATALLEGAPGVRLCAVPTPLAAVGGDDSLVGRIRQHPGHPRRLSFFVSGDNLRKGAALNAVQIAELLVGRGGV